jgi:diguanylate cyclase (GGDEF)-like protein
VGLKWLFGGADESVRPTAPVTVEATPSTVPASQELDDALDTVGAMLRALGKFPVLADPGEATATAADCERWAQHIVNRGPHPETGPRQKGVTLATPRRDWGGARKFVTAIRKNESQSVAQAVHDLRAIAWAFIQSLAHVAKQEGQTDNRMMGELEKLRAAATAGSTQELRRQAVAVADTLQSVLDERRSRQREVMATLGAQVQALGGELEQAKREGARDGLTGLNNRRAFDEYLERTADLNRVFGTPALLILIDADHFKQVNDRHGHPAGDAVLKALSDCLTRSFPRRGDFIARYGGEEFAVLLRDVTLEAATALCHRLLDSVRAMSIKHDEKTLKITVSAGVAEIGGETTADWIARADQALYKAKRGGRDRVIVAGKA